MSARKKVTVVGGGMTGGAIAQRLVENIADVVIQDDPQFAGTLHHGKALDMTQSASWLGFETKITAHATAGKRPPAPTSSSARRARPQAGHDAAKTCSTATRTSCARRSRTRRRPRRTP